MSETAFPIDNYLEAIVHLLDTIEYKGITATRTELTQNLQYAYSKAAKHFVQLQQRQLIKLKPQQLQVLLQTIVRMVVYSLPNLPQQVMADLSIHWIYLLILDDSLDDSSDKLEICMQSFFSDLVTGKPQKHPWWRMVNEQIPMVLQHYGPFCALNMVRSTIDFFQGHWIEQYNFQGFPGSYDYPKFLRRLNGVGQSFAAAMFPTAQFSECELFTEITSAIAQVQDWIAFVNDLMSLYKEFGDPRDQTSLVNNYCLCNGITFDQALDKLTRDTISCSEQIMAVFNGDKDPRLVATIQASIQGWVTWHLCDPRYRLDELIERAGDGPSVARLRLYQQAASQVAAVRLEEWAIPSVVELAEQQD